MRKNVIGGEHLEERFKRAGFEQIKVYKRRIHIGDWGNAGISLPSLYILGLFRFASFWQLM